MFPLDNLTQFSEKQSIYMKKCCVSQRTDFDSLQIVLAASPWPEEKSFVITYKVTECCKVNIRKVNTVNESVNTETFTCIGTLFSRRQLTKLTVHLCQEEMKQTGNINVIM